jgi:hypothetical protein
VDVVAGGAQIVRERAHAGGQALRVVEEENLGHGGFLSGSAPLETGMCGVR